MILLQTEAAGLFDALMQQGILFGFMGLVIYVLARRIKVLEKKIDDMMDDKIAETKEHTLIIREATEAMKAKTTCNYEADK